jgi:acyl-CoA reductase-like NAD-dependent aldehyde dehydrogenase
MPKSSAEERELRVPLLIGGRCVETAEWQAVSNPAAPRQIVGYAASATKEQARQAVGVAQGAWKEWSALEPARRAELLLAALNRLDEAREQRAELLVRENGKVRFEAELDLGAFAMRSRMAAGLAHELKNVRQFRSEAEPGAGHAPGSQGPGPAFRTEVAQLSLGVVTIIVPYNWPLAILAASLPYALIAGNTVIVKVPPTSPLSLSQTLELLAAGLPPGVLNVMSGTNEAVAPLITDPRVGRVVFTGSTQSGKAVMKLAAESLTRVTLELGGNDPAIVLEDAELDRAAVSRLALASFLTAGQVCMGIKRIYVHRSRYADLVSGLSEVLSEYRVGNGLWPSTTMGPLNTARQRDFVRSLTDEAHAAGHEVRELGTLDEDVLASRGHFLRPALVLDPAPDLRIVTEEQFGPALPILRYDDLDSVIEQVNGGWSGLCSSVWTADPERAASVAARLRTGTTWINNANAMALDDRAPFGGFRQSGIGRELGVDGLLEFTEAHTITYPG